MPNTIPRRIIGKRTQFDQWFKFNEWKAKLHHNKNYGVEIIAPLLKKWINDHTHQIGHMNIQYDMTYNVICMTRVIPPHKPSWPPVLYLIHQKKNLLRDMQ